MTNHGSELGWSIVSGRSCCTQEAVHLLHLRVPVVKITLVLEWRIIIRVKYFKVLHEKLKGNKDVKKLINHFKTKCWN